MTASEPAVAGRRATAARVLPWLLIAAVPLRGVLLMDSARRLHDTPFLAALRDYLVYSLLISEMLPMTLAPGEITSIMAIALYARELPKAGGRRR